MSSDQQIFKEGEDRAVLGKKKSAKESPSKRSDQFAHLEEEFSQYASREEQ